ncbi:SulP family inorganic anion transporter [Streptomyces hydrogenans]|uniref:SulP family inorganic anion transporter n=1 Tax=Streptomyces hydrogenans TaxID=1873719 RepID=UPI0035E02449
MSFVSNAVMTGFSTGIALQIITGVLKDAPGYKPEGHNKLYQLGNWLWHVGDWRLAAALTAVTTSGVWAAARAVRRLEPVALLIARVTVSVTVALPAADGELVQDIAAIPSTPPSFTAPDLTAAPDLSAAPHLLRGAVSVALVALAQAVGIAPSLPDPDGTRSDINGDFRSQGYANLAGGLFQALPSGGSLSRTGVAVSAGARTRWAGVVSGVFLALVVLLCGSLAERTPMPVIGGLILVVGGELIRGKRHDILRVLLTAWMSAGAMVLTFVATTRLPLQQAVILGAALSLILYCAQAARQAKLVALVRADDGHWRTAEPAAALPPGGHRPRLRGIVVLRRAAPHRGPASRPDGARGAVLILVVRALPDVPLSAMIKLPDRYARHLGDQDGRLVLCGVQPSLAHLLQRSGTADRLGDGGVVPATPELLGGLEEAWVAARERTSRPPHHGSDMR